MSNNYKYDPEVYSGILGLSEDLADFYTSHDAYMKEASIKNRFAFEKKGRELFFTVKHREVEGFLSPTEAEEFREYMKGLLDD